MKTANPAVLAAALYACLAAAPAQADTFFGGGAYVRGEVSGGFAGDYNNGPDLDNSILYGAAIGTHVSPHVRVEAEYLHSGADFSNAPGNSQGNIGIANAYYDFGDRSRLTPFIGAGVGYGHFDTSAGDDSSVAYQAIAGVSRDLSPNLTGEIAYKYLAAPDLTIAGADTGFRSNYLGAGLRFKFGS